MRRRNIRPYGNSIPRSRLLTMIVGLVAVGALYHTVRKEENWKWVHRLDSNQIAAHVDPVPATGMIESQSSGRRQPASYSDDEWQKFQRNVEVIRDRSELMRREMPAYWQLMSWCKSETAKELWSRGLTEPSFSEFWEAPSTFRGVPVRLKLHVRRVLQYEAPQNEAGIRTVFEVWGWTELSKSFPYVVVLQELPGDLRVGPDVEYDLDVVGYFLKNMAYSAFDKKLAAPLMVGKAMPAAQQTLMTRPAQSGDSLRWVFILAMLSLAMLLWRKLNGTAQARVHAVQVPEVFVADVLQFDSLPSTDSAQSGADSALRQAEEETSS